MENHKKIYTITTIREKGSRCVWFYFDVIKAIKNVVDNAQDINEVGYYSYCVIEEVEEGIYFLDRKELWFKWDLDKHCYVQLPKKPKRFSRRVCFGIG